MKLPLIAALLTLGFLTACGEEPASEPTSTSTTSATETTEPPGPALDDPEAVLLTLDDLPDGYVIESSTAGGTPPVGADEEVQILDGPPQCARLFDTDSELHETAVVDYAAVGFANLEFSPFLEHAVSLYDDPQALDDEFALYEQVLDDCDGASVTVADADGFQLAMDLRRVDFADLGDRSSALAMSGVLVEHEVEVEVIFVLVQVGQTTSNFSTTGMAGQTLPVSTFEDLAALGIDRLAAAL